MIPNSFADPLTGDAEIAGLVDTKALIAAMIRFEAALAEAEGATGTIPPDAAQAITTALARATVAPEELAAGLARDGVPVPALVARLRAMLGDGAGAYLHWGATSQDALDTALVLCLGEAAGVLRARLDRAIRGLAAQARAHKGTVLAARTRAQIAVPTSLGLKLAGWVDALLRHRARLIDRADGLAVLQFGGAGGNLGALGADGPAIARALADRLDLALPDMPWHGARDRLVDFAGALALIAGTGGKIGTDVMLLSQTEVGEITAGAAGGSSTMPHKANPILAETLIALARQAAGEMGALHHALIHAQERDGAAWTGEWAAIPRLAAACGASLTRLVDAAESLRVDQAAMRAHLDAQGGAALAEAASFALARHMPRPDAAKRVAEAARTARDTGRHLMEVLADDPDAGAVDWTRARDPARHLGAADAFVDAVLARAETDLALP